MDDRLEGATTDRTTHARGVNRNERIDLFCRAQSRGTNISDPKRAEDAGEHIVIASDPATIPTVSSRATWASVTVTRSLAR